MTIQAAGANAQILIKSETNWGEVRQSGKAIRLGGALYGESLTYSKEELRSNAINPFRGVMDTTGGQKSAGGGVPFELPLENGEMIFYGLMGQYVQTEEGDLKKKVFKRHKTLPSFTIEKGFTDNENYFAFTGSKIQDLQLSVTPDGLVTGSFNVISKGVLEADESIDDTPLAFDHQVIRGIDAVVLEGAQGADFTAFNMNINNGLNQARKIGSDVLASLNAGIGEVTGDVSFMFTDRVMFEKWVNETQTDIKITFVIDGKSVEFYFPRVKFNGEACPVIDSGEGINITLQWRALVDKNLGTDVIITTKNDYDLDAALA